VGPQATTVVLAAGSGNRFGGAKQLASVGGRPMLRRVLDALSGVCEAQVVVLGAAAERVRTVVPEDEWRVAVAGDWADGPGASLRAGLAAAPLATAVLIALGDLPWLSREAAERVLRSAADHPSYEAVRAFDSGSPGHPLLLRGRLLEVARAAPDAGMQAVLAAAPVLSVPCEGLGVAQDVDTPDQAVDPRAGRARHQ
jgi:nicotine blue oxidoreductase